MGHAHVAAAEITKFFAERKMEIKRKRLAVPAGVCLRDLALIISGGEPGRKHWRRRIGRVSRALLIEFLQYIEIYRVCNARHNSASTNIFDAQLFNTAYQILSILDPS